MIGRTFRSCGIQAPDGKIQTSKPYRGHNKITRGDARLAVFLHDEWAAGGHAVARVQSPDLAPQCHILIQSDFSIGFYAWRWRRLRRLRTGVLCYCLAYELRSTSFPL